MTDEKETNKYLAARESGDIDLANELEAKLLETDAARRKLNQQSL